ncbi:MAG: molybdopterin molybdotransferase MoeA [Lachnospiraceae bacterium]|nr:molybdopterin molybdotransferase MoeA [Lachnospiraceae bacterium]
MEKERTVPFNIPVEEAKQLLLDTVTTIDTEIIPLEEGLGRISASEIRAKEDIPSFDRSPLDGYAVRSADLARASKETPVTLKVQEEVPAGYVAKEPVKEGYVVKICTGAPIPEGADAIVKFEETEFTPLQATFFASVKPDSNIVHRGSDIQEGRLVLSPGKVLDPADLGMLASLGFPEIEVYRKPKVILFSTGDELVPVDGEITPGKIRNSSAYLLKGILEKNGCQVTLGGIVKDSLEELETSIKQALKEADLVMTTGGVSVGDYDYTPAVFKKIGADVLFWKTRLKPGMATVAAVKDGQLIIGLSGNPSAAAAGLYRAVLPALNKLSGRAILEPEEMTVTFLEAFDKKSPGGRVLPGRLCFKDGKTCIKMQSKQENGMISNWGGCNVLALVEKGRGPIQAGETCQALYLG